MHTLRSHFSMVILLALVFCAPTKARAGGEAELYLESGKAVSLPSILDPLRIMRVKRVVEKIYLLRENTSILLGILGDPDTGNGPDVIALDINFDGEPEFLLRETGGNLQSEYYLVDARGKRDMAKQLFPHGTTNEGLGNNCFELPELNATNKTLSFRHRSGATSITETYAFREGSYSLAESTGPASEASAFLLEKRIRYTVNGKQQGHTLRLYADTSNKPVRAMLLENTPLYPDMKALNATKPALPLPAATPVTLLDIVETADGRWFRVATSEKQGWIAERSLLAYAAAPINPLELPEKKTLSASKRFMNPVFAAQQALLVLEQHRDTKGELWARVYNSEGLTGWVRQVELAPVGKE